jgi:hypothetical protein
MIFKHSHRRTERRLFEMFTSGISDAKRRRLLVEVDSCEQCRAMSRSYHRAESALSFAGAAVSPFAAERMALGIFSQHADKPTKRRYVGAKLAAALVPVAALAIAVLLLLPDSPSFRVNLPKDFSAYSTELVSRGGTASASASSDFGIRSFAISRDNRRVRERDKISINSLLTFTYTRTEPTPGYLLLFGVQDSKNVIWYYPDFGENESIEIQGDRVDEPLGDGFNISANHEKGPLLIAALFSEEPISVDRIETIVDKHKSLSPSIDQWRSSMKEALGEDVTPFFILSTVEDDND